MSKLYVNEVHSKTGSTKALEIDSDGRLTTPARPAFHTKKSTNGNVTYAASAIVSADMVDGVETNVGGHYKTSGVDAGYFVAPVAGLYYFGMTLFNNSTAAKRVSLIRSSDNTAFAGQGSSDSYVDFTCSGLTHLDAGEKVFIRNSYDSTIIYQGPNHSFWYGYLIG